uniref:Uncharacterized protein n=1 Tax=Rhipicephalus zambeziensis TaxID=60191 RepID=A0A224Z1Y6_9ACAR
MIFKTAVVIAESKFQLCGCQGVNGLLQYVTEPTRENSILDLLFCNSPHLVNSTSVIPGLSDHQAVVATVVQAGRNIHYSKYQG